MRPKSSSHAPLNVNERRTRRGVYATIIAREADSDESENEEDNNKIPLAGANDIPTDGEIELTTEIDIASELTSLTPSIPSPDTLTPAPDPPLPRFSSSLSSLSSVGDACDSSTPFSSQAQQTQQATLQAPPLSASPTKRLTRSTSALSAEKAATSSSETPKRDHDLVPVKKEQVEPRVLRTRPFAPTVPEPRKFPQKPDTPRGADGKLLPTCATCNNILPLISVNSKVVWGLGFENGKKKRSMIAQGMPFFALFPPFFPNGPLCSHSNRCLRHFAIYHQPWPRRVSAHGGTPREESTPASDASKRVTHKSLPRPGSQACRRRLSE